MLVETGSETGGIEQDEKEMIHGVIELAETKVHEVMVPRIGIRPWTSTIRSTKCWT